MIPIKTDKEIEIMQEGGKILAEVLEKLISSTRIGVKTKDLDNLAEKLIKKKGGSPSFKGYNGFPASLCVNINEGVVHGIPNDYKIQGGDLVTFDLGVFYRDFHTDSALTFGVGKINSGDKRFLEIGKRALYKAINKAKEGKRLEDISSTIQSIVEDAGFSVVKTLVGHGVGKSLHEKPPIPGFGLENSGPLLKKGMVLAIEVIYNQGAEEIKTEKDGWTVKAADGRKAGLFEHTVAITEKGPLVLTKRIKERFQVYSHSGGFG